MVPGPLGVLTASTDSLTDDTSARLGKVIQDLSIISKLEQLILFSIQKKKLKSDFSHWSQKKKNDMSIPVLRLVVQLDISSFSISLVANCYCIGVTCNMSIV